MYSNTAGSDWRVEIRGQLCDKSNCPTEIIPCSSPAAPLSTQWRWRGTQYLLLQPLQHRSQQGLPVLLVGLHLLLQFFLGVLDEVVVLLEGLLDHLALVLPLLCQVLQQFSLLALGAEEGTAECNRATLK